MIVEDLQGILIITILLKIFIIILLLYLIEIIRYYCILTEWKLQTLKLSLQALRILKILILQTQIIWLYEVVLGNQNTLFE